MSMALISGNGFCAPLIQPHLPDTKDGQQEFFVKERGFRCWIYSMLHGIIGAKEGWRMKARRKAWIQLTAAHIQHSRICDACFYRIGDFVYWWESMACSDWDDKKEEKIERKQE